MNATDYGRLLDDLGAEAIDRYDREESGGGRFGTDEYEQGGGPLIDIGTHALDLTLWTMNNYKPKYCVGTTYHKLNNDTATGSDDSQAAAIVDVHRNHLRYLTDEEARALQEV